MEAINLKSLGRTQKIIIQHLKEGAHIHLFKQYSPYEFNAELKNEDDWIGFVTNTQIYALCKRNIIIGKMVYSTTMPDTESWKFVINPEIKSWKQ